MTWAKLTAPFRDFGLGAGCVYALDRVLRRISPRLGLHYYELVEQPVGGRVLLPPAHAQQVRFIEVSPGAAELEAMPPPAAIKRARFDQGAVCLAVYMHERYVGYVWFCFQRYEEDEVRCTYELRRPAQSAFDFDLYVFPQYRMGRAFVAVWHAANQYLAARGVVRTCSRITRFNTASWRAHAQLNARVVGRDLALRVGSWQALWSTALPFPGVCMGWRRRPRLAI